MGKFMARIVGTDFELTMQGSGNTTSAGQYLEEVFPGCNVTVTEFGEADLAGRE